MLSPASLRVCCLAVMAPALTKADRRANCLPVVLSDPFCVSKTDTSDNRKDKINQIAKLPFKCAPLPNKRKPPHKIWVRTNGDEIPTNKNRLSAIDLQTDFVNAKLGLHVEPKTKPCHGTSVRTMAAKVRLKYTMNKNNNSFKNMGLAKANTSLGLHSMKRMDRISQLSPNDKRISPGLGKDSGENLPDLADPTSSELETTFSIVRIVQPALEQSIEEVSSSSRNLIASSKHETFVSLSDSETLPVLSDASVTAVVSDNCSIPLSPDINSSLSSRDLVLPISLPDTESPLDASRNDARNASLSDILAQPQSPLISAPVCDIILTHKADTENASVGSVEEKAPLPSTSDASIFNVSPTNECSSHVNSFTVPHSSCTTEKDIHTPFEDEMSPLSPPFSPRCPSDIEAASPCSTFSSSSTLSADESPLPSSMDEGGDSAFLQFPDSLLGPKKPLVEVQSLGFTHLPYSTVKSWFENSPCIPEGNVRLPSEACCSLPKQDQYSLVAMLTEQEKVLNVALKETEVLLREYTIGHVQEQIRTFVAQFQKKYDIPCQRQSRNAVSKAAVDLKAELLQGEDVKSLSTAALVSLVRRLESGASPANQPQDNELLTEAAATAIAPEDYDDMRNTSKALLTNMKNLLRSADPYMTESSDEGSSDVEMDDALDDSIQKRALWNFMKKRAALASRSTWLIARIHELENQLNTITGILKKISTSIGDVPFEERADSESSALSTAGSDGTSLQAVKPNRPKGLGRPVNGYLDHGFGGQTKGGSETLERKLSASSVVNTEPMCSRTRALKTSAFQKRKVLVTTGMHLTNVKLAKFSTVGCECNCQDEVLPCILCTGRYNCVQSIDPDSLPLLDRVSLLDPNFHPLLSFEKDVPLLVHYENILKKNEAQYQSVRPPSPVLNSHRRMRFGASSNHFGDARSRSRKINRYARTLLSAKYRNKKHFRKHKLVFGKWRKFQNKSTFHARDRIRRLSVASSASSHDSPVPSPGSTYDDGFGYDLKRRRDDNQFDIDDVIIPYSNKKSRLVKFEFKDIEIPSWRSKAFGNLQAIDIEEDTSDVAFVKRHEGYEIEERKIIRNGGGAKCFFNTWQKRSSRMHRSDSRADSSGANTPDPVLLYDQDIMFQDTNSQLTSNPPSPALSPPATPGSAHLISDDSQPALRAERRRSGGAKRPEEFSNSRDYDEIAPYSPRVFPLSDNAVDEMLADADHTRYDTDVTASGPSCPASPDSSTSSATTVDDEDITDPEWRVVRRESGPEQALVLKFAKR